MNDYESIRNTVNTGDIVLFSGRNSIISSTIKFFTHSAWSHVGMVIKDQIRDLIYLWESTTLTDVNDVIDKIPKKGVQLVLLSERIKKYQGKIAIRFLQGVTITDDSKEMQALMQLRKEIKNRPYEQNKMELIRATIDNTQNMWRNVEDLSSLFCSELVAEAYQKLELLDETEPSNEYIPKDFSSEGNIKLCKNAILAPEIIIKD